MKSPTCPLLPPINFQKFLDENKDKLQPPVCNTMMYGQPDGQFKLMVVGGPNHRKDYHVEEGEEWFYQIKGDMKLKIVENGHFLGERNMEKETFRDIIIKEGEMFMLPAHVPHSPQRFADTVGIVIERARDETELDVLRWYCDDCRHVVHQATLHCTDLGTQLKPVIEGYYASEEQRTCPNCGKVDQPPAKAE